MAELYAVQPCIDPGEPTFGEATTVNADGAITAAEKVLSRPLAITGERKDLAARVVRMAENFRADFVMVYNVAVANENEPRPQEPAS